MYFVVHTRPGGFADATLAILASKIPKAIFRTGSILNICKSFGQEMLIKAREAGNQ